MSILVPEYRSYGIYKHSSEGKKLEPSIESILDDALDVWNFVTKDRKEPLDESLLMPKISHRSFKYQENLNL